MGVPVWASTLMVLVNSPSWMEIEPPLIVFVTAYQEHAVRAFEANAVNYLMKPVDEDKLADTLERVRGVAGFAC